MGEEASVPASGPTPRSLDDWQLSGNALDWGIRQSPVSRLQTKPLFAPLLNGTTVSFGELSKDGDCVQKGPPPHWAINGQPESLPRTPSLVFWSWLSLSISGPQFPWL